MIRVQRLLPIEIIKGLNNMDKGYKNHWIVGIRELLALLLLGFVGFYINRYIRIEGLYMDDLYMWSCYGEQSFWEFAFPIGTSTRFRPVYWIATYLEMMLVRNHPGLFVPVNIILNVLTAYLIYGFARKLSRGNFPVALLAGGMYLISHFSYYQIGQALGLLETMSLFMAILILWLLHDFLTDGKTRHFYLACLTYFLLVFSHERYLALLPLFYLALLFAPRRKNTGAMSSAEKRGRIFRFLLPLLMLLVIIGIRRYAIGTALPAGTGGTEVTDTFSLGQALQFSFQQVMYLFGVNIGPTYLAGISWADFSPVYRKLVYLSWIPLAILVLSYLVLSLRDGRFAIAKKNREFWGRNLLFLAFIALCIGCSSITIRVEMRWVYVSYAASLLYLSLMCGECTDLLGRGRAEKRYRAAEGEGSRKVLSLSATREKRAYGQRLGRMAAIVFTIPWIMYAGCMAPVERYDRAHFYDIYFWEDQDRMNSLAAETVLKYGTDAVLGKQVYILENSYGMSDFYARTFFKVYDPEKTGQGTEIHFVDSVEALAGLGLTQENALVLQEVPAARGYQDITEEVLP